MLAMVSTLGEGPAPVEDLEGALDEARARDDSHFPDALVGCAHARLFRGEPLAAQAHFEELVAVARRRGNDGMVATGLVGMGAAAVAQGDCECARDRLTEGTALAADVGEVHTRLIGTIWLAEVARLSGHARRAQQELLECLAPARSMGAPYPLALALLGLGRTALDQGDVEGARDQLEEALAVAREARLGHLEAGALEGLGVAARALGDSTAAQQHLARALDVAKRFGEKTATARATYRLAQQARHRDELDVALALHRDALRDFYALGVFMGVADSLDALAGLAVARGNLDVAARLFGSSDALREARGLLMTPPRSDRYHADVALARQGLGPEQFDAAWRQGAELTADEAVAYASKRSGRRGGSSPESPGLSPTERQVVDLVLEGLTNAEVAERLFVSPETVKTHLSKAFAKLRVRSRRELRAVLVRDAERGGHPTKRD
jgi:DNA-binding CsgD family transcriptional regulator/tetratricopeptide (TPR) repeat protein